MTCLAGWTSHIATAHERRPGPPVTAQPSVPPSEPNPTSNAVKPRPNAPILWVILIAMGSLLSGALLGCDRPATEPHIDASAPSPDDTTTQADAERDVEDLPREADEAAEPATFPDFAEMVSRVRPAVVNIYTRTDPPSQRDPAAMGPPGIVPDQRVRESLGSGFIFDEAGLVLTNDHVVRDASEIAVRLLDERVFSAEVIGSDPPTDIAILELQEIEEDLPIVELGDSDKLEVGNWVLAIGNPLGLASTVTAGIASGTGRQVMPPGGRLRFQDFIQTDASINPGSSGGPLVNTAGAVIGIATATSSSGQGLGFALPVNMVHEILPDLIEHGRVERSWLGIYVGEVPTRLREELDLPDQGGAMLTRLVDGGPAEQAELQPADIFLEINDEEVLDASHLSWLAATIGVDETVDVVIQRGSERLTLPLTLGALPEQ